MPSITPMIKMSASQIVRNNLLHCVKCKLTFCKMHKNYVYANTLQFGQRKPLMFSTTPITGIFTFLQKFISLRTSSSDTS